MERHMRPRRRRHWHALDEPPLGSVRPRPGLPRAPLDPDSRGFWRTASMGYIRTMFGDGSVGTGQRQVRV